VPRPRRSERQQRGQLHAQLGDLGGQVLGGQHPDHQLAGLVEVVPFSSQRGGPIALASDNPLRAPLRASMAGEGAGDLLLSSAVVVLGLKNLVWPTARSALESGLRGGP
jgi:hypothetical protein